MPQLPSGAVYELKPQIALGGGQQLHASTYGIKIPAGLAASNAPAPVFIDPTKMVSLLKADGGGHGPGLGIVHGLTVTELALTFSDPAKQWQQVSGVGPMPKWQFVGGDVFLNATITVYVLQGDQPDPKDKLATKIFAIIMQHELLHVLDEVDIVSRWMLPQAYADEMVVKHLTNAGPMEDSKFQIWVKGNGFTDWIRDGIWAPEHNRRGKIRDAANQYAKLQSQIQDLQVQRINRP